MVEALLLAPVRADHVGGDAVKPRPGAVPGQVVALAVSERGDEHLRGQVVGGFVADPPGQVLVYRCEIALEDDGEPLRPGPRLLDHRGIGLRWAGELGSHGQGSRPSTGGMVTL